MALGSVGHGGQIVTDNLGSSGYLTPLFCMYYSCVFLLIVFVNEERNQNKNMSLRLTN